jgi:hypothetical protein
VSDKDCVAVGEREQILLCIMLGVGLPKLTHDLRTCLRKVERAGMDCQFVLALVNGKEFQGISRIYFRLAFAFSGRL